jgi:carboxynorspermidine decarboxylase
MGMLPSGLDTISSPAFMYDEAVIQRLLRAGETLRQNGACRLLFAIKSFAFLDALKFMAPNLDGFAVSSPFEARLARCANDHGGTIHITTPGIRGDEIDEIGDLCDFISFNSLSHWDRYQDRTKEKASCGLRVNPQMSFVDDQRYDPCRPYSKLGVPLEDLVTAFGQEPGRISGLRGILFHSNCDSSDFGELLATVQHVCSRAAPVLARVQWINLGGGYLFDHGSDFAPFIEAVNLLKKHTGAEVYFEPGSALVRAAGYIVSTVLDVFPSDGKTIAVLDTTVNHMPEVLEYGFQPDVVGHDDDAPHGYLLAGSTCLAGDVFGCYRFEHPLRIGDKVVFNNAGSYTLAKAHPFNGIGLPAVYALTTQGGPVLKSRFTFDHFAARWGAGPHAAL